MLNANDSQIKLEKYHADCVKFWTRQNGIDEREAYKRAKEKSRIYILGFFMLTKGIGNYSLFL